MAIGSVSVHVVPDASGFWERFRAQTQAGSDRDIRVRVNADTAAARAEIDSLGRSTDRASHSSNLLLDALAAIGPAAVPIGAVAVGAIAGLLPAAAAAALGVKGIVEEFKSGALAGTQFQAPIAGLKTEFQNLKAIAAGGLLPGVTAGIQNAQPLFKAFNTDVAVMSAQIGGIAAHAGPALLNVLDQLSPLFTTFGNELVRGATELENWAAHTTGITSFVHYVQSQIPAVEHLLGGLVELVGHLSQGLAPLGGITLTSLGLLVRVLDSLPVGVLQVLLPLIIETRTALLAYRGVTAGITAISNAYNAVSTAVQGFADRNNVAQLQMQAVSARTARQAAVAAATQANAQAEAAAASVAATERQITAEESYGLAVESTSREILAARQAEALATAEAAAASVAAQREASAAAVTSAERVATAQKAAKVGWLGALGPVGALAAGVGLLSLAFFHSGDSATIASKANEAYAESVKQSTNALDNANLAATSKQIIDSGAARNLQTLIDANQNLGITYQDLTSAINGSVPAASAIGAKLQEIAANNRTYSETVNSATGATTKQAIGYNTYGKAAIGLSQDLGTLRGALGRQIAQQQLLNKIQQESELRYAGGSAAAQATARALGLQGSAYLAAVGAAKKSTDQAAAQTAQWQLENEAGQILAGTLDKLSGKNLSYAEAQNQFEQSLISLNQQIHGTSKSIVGMSAAAVQNRSSLLQQVQAAEQSAESYGKMTGSSVAARNMLGKLRQEIIDNAVAHGINRASVIKYLDSVLDVVHLKVPPTKFDVNKAAADAKIATLKAEIASVRPKTVGIGVSAAQAQVELSTLLYKLAQIQDKNFYVNEYTVVHQSYTSNAPQRIGYLAARGYAEGGQIQGPGTDKSDSILARLSNNEFVVRAAQAKKHLALLNAINSGAEGFADGGMVGRKPTMNRSKDATVTAGPTFNFNMPVADERAAIASATRRWQMYSRA